MSRGCGDIKKFSQLIGNLGGRDKVNKSIQYGAKLMKYIVSHYASSDPELAKKFGNLSNGVGLSRKVDRLFKSLIELQKAIDAYNTLQLNNSESTIKYLTIFAAFSYFFYWYFDNQVFLSKIKVFPSIDAAAKKETAAKFQFFGIIAMIILIKLKLDKINAKSIDNTDNSKQDKIEQDIWINKLKLLGLFGDLIVSSNNAGYVKRLRGENFNDGIVGISGLISALTVLYRSWPQ